MTMNPKTASGLSIRRPSHSLSITFHSLLMMLVYLLNIKKVNNSNLVGNNHRIGAVFKVGTVSGPAEVNSKRDFVPSVLVAPLYVACPS